MVEELFAEGDDGENPELATARALVERQYAAKLAAGKRDQVAAALARRGSATRSYARSYPTTSNFAAS